MSFIYKNSKLRGPERWSDLPMIAKPSQDKLGPLLAPSLYHSTLSVRMILASVKNQPLRLTTVKLSWQQSVSLANNIWWWIIQWLGTSPGSVTSLHARTLSLWHRRHLERRPCGISDKWHLMDMCCENLWSESPVETERCHVSRKRIIYSVVRSLSRHLLGALL